MKILRGITMTVTLFLAKQIQAFSASVSLIKGNNDEETDRPIASAPLVWKANMSAACVATPALSPDSSLVLIGCNDHHLYALYTQNGTLAWDRTLSGRIQASVLMSKEGIAYVGSDSGDLMALDAATGDLQWRRSLCGQAIKGTPALRTANDKTQQQHHHHHHHHHQYHHHHHHHHHYHHYHHHLQHRPQMQQQQPLLLVPAGQFLILLHAETGGTIASVELGGEIETTPVVGLEGTMVYVASTDSVLYAIDIREPAKPFIEWKYETGEHIDFQSSPTLSIDGSTAYVGGYSRRLHAIDVSTGQARWSFQANDTVATASVSEEDGTVLVGSSDRHLYAIEPNNGTLRWSYRTPSPIQSRPGISPFSSSFQHEQHNKVVAVGTSGKHVYGLKLETGQPLWSFATEGWVVSSPIQGPECSVVFGSLDHHVYRIGHCQNGVSLIHSAAFRDEL